MKPIWKLLLFNRKWMNIYMLYTWHTSFELQYEKAYYGKCPKISKTKVTDKMISANSADPDQTLIRVYTVCHSTILGNICIINTIYCDWQIDICKQCRPRSDCSWRIRVYTVCHFTISGNICLINTIHPQIHRNKVFEILGHLLY